MGPNSERGWIKRLSTDYKGQRQEQQSGAGIIIGQLSIDSSQLSFLNTPVASNSRGQSLIDN